MGSICSEDKNKFRQAAQWNKWKFQRYCTDLFMKEVDFSLPVSTGKFTSVAVISKDR